MRFVVVSSELWGCALVSVWVSGRSNAPVAQVGEMPILG